MDLQKNELIGKLKKISELYEHAVAIRSQMDTLEPEDNYERTVVVPRFPGEYESEEDRRIWTQSLEHTLDAAPQIAEATHRKVYGPKEPEKPELKPFVKPACKDLQQKQSKSKSLSYLGAGVGIFFFLGIISCRADSSYGALPVVIILMLAGAATFAFFRMQFQKAKKEEEGVIAGALQLHNRQQEELKADYAEKMKAYESECARYEGQLKTFLKDYRDWRRIYLQSVEEEAQIEKKLEADRAAAVDKLRQEQYIPALEKLQESNDLVSQEYLPALGVLIELLGSGRADDLKEAINLYEDILYRERQLQLQREQEEQRRLEEEQRRQDEERRHQQQMQQRREEERQRRYEEQQRRQDEERRHREDMQQREAEARNREMQERERMRRAEADQARRQREQENSQWAAAKQQCRACAHAARCNMTVYNKTPNCTGFTPRR